MLFVLGVHVAEVSGGKVRGGLGVGPRGSYCASYGGIGSGRATFQSSSEFSVGVNVFGQNITCTGERYKYDPKTHLVIVPGATDPNDCIGKYLTAYGVRVVVRYDESANALDITANGTFNITASSC